MLSESRTKGFDVHEKDELFVDLPPPSLPLCAAAFMADVYLASKLSADNSPAWNMEEEEAPPRPDELPAEAEAAEG